MHRRTLLQLCGVGFSGLLSGCSVLRADKPSPISVSHIELRNRLDKEVDVSILLLDEGDVAYWQTVSVPPQPNPFATLDDLPTEAGEYVLYAQIPATPNDPPVHVDLTEAGNDSSCITVHMDVMTANIDGDEVPAVAYGTIGDCQSET